MTTTTLAQVPGTYVAMTVTNLQSLANDSSDPFGAWQSARVASGTAVDYEIHVKCPTAATSPANDQSAYVYLVPWVTSDGGTTWLPGANFGTTTLPTAAEGTASVSDPNSMKGPVAMPYKVTLQQLDVWFNVAVLCGGILPDGWSLAIRNCTGAAFSTGCVVEYRPIAFTNS